MKLRRTLILALSCAGVAFAADKYSAVTGVWRAQMDGLPALTMTISDEGGELTGAILFYLIVVTTGSHPAPPREAPNPCST